MTDKEILERIRQMGERQRAGLPTVPKKEKKLSYYERHKEERRKYQREYARAKYGYRPKDEIPKRTEEEKKEYNRQNAAKYNREHKEKYREYHKNYYWTHKEYFSKKARERYIGLRNAERCQTEYADAGGQD